VRTLYTHTHTCTHSAPPKPKARKAVPKAATPSGQPPAKRSKRIKGKSAPGDFLHMDEGLDDEEEEEDVKPTV